MTATTWAAPTPGTSTEAPAEWVIDWRGNTWKSTDLTGEHASAVAELLNIDPTWDWFDVSELHPARGPLALMALIAAFTCVDQEVVGVAARRAVLDAIKEASLDELIASVRIPN